MVSQLVQFPCVVSTLEVLQTCSYQLKIWLNIIEGIDPYGSMLMTFDLNNIELCLSRFVFFHVIVIVKGF